MIRRLLRASVGAALLGALTTMANAEPPYETIDVQTAIRNGFFLGWIPPSAAGAESKKTPPRVEDDVLNDIPPKEIGWIGSRADTVEVLTHAKYTDWFSWIMAHWTARQHPLPPEKNEGYLHPIATGADYAYQVANEPPVLANDTEKATSVEVLPMPHEDGVTCPYLRQQMLDRHAVHAADAEVGHDVLDNLARLKQAEELLDLAAKLANKGCLDEAKDCCERAARLCPGSPSAERAADTKRTLALGIVPPSRGGEEAAETPEESSSDWRLFWRQMFETMGLPLKDDAGVTDLKQLEAEWERIWFTDMPSKMTPERLHGGIMPGDPESKKTEPGREEMVCGLMKACHLLVSQGMHHQAAEMARQAFALDPELVQADPLIYKMHLLAASPPSGASEESEPPTCPYCGNSGKPIRDILAEPKKSASKSAALLVPPLPKVDAEVVPALERVLAEEAKPSEGAEEASEDIARKRLKKTVRELLSSSPFDWEMSAENGPRLSVDFALGDHTYHLRCYPVGLTVWDTTDAARKMP